MPAKRQAAKKDTATKRGFRDRSKQTLFINARKLGSLIDCVHRELTDAELDEHSNAHFHAGTATRVFAFHLN